MEALARPPCRRQSCPSCCSQAVQPSFSLAKGSWIVWLCPDVAQCIQLASISKSPLFTPPPTGRSTFVTRRKQLCCPFRKDNESHVACREVLSQLVHTVYTCSFRDILWSTNWGRAASLQMQNPPSPASKNEDFRLLAISTRIPEASGGSENLFLLWEESAAQLGLAQIQDMTSPSHLRRDSMLFLLLPWAMLSSFTLQQALLWWPSGALHGCALWAHLKLIPSSRAGWLYACHQWRRGSSCSGVDWTLITVKEKQ